MSEPESEPQPVTEDIDYTLRLCKAVLERYARDYVKKMYGKEDGIKIELEFNPHFAEQELPHDDGTKAIKWALLSSVVVSTLKVNIDLQAIDTDNLVESVHSDILSDIGMEKQDVGMQVHEMPTEVDFSVNANSPGKLAQKMGISLRDLQTAMLEIHDHGVDDYKALTLNHGKERGGR